MKWFYRLISLFAGCLFLVPIVWMLIVSVKKEGMKITSLVDWFTPPYSFAVYNEIISQTKLRNWVWNSFVVAIVVTV
jgi:multiple sugar transport system permease protein